MIVLNLRTQLFKGQRLINCLHNYGYMTRLVHGQKYKEKVNLKPRLFVKPKTDLYDNLLNIQVGGLESHKPITLKAEMREDQGKLLYSNAHYVADQNGLVDVSASASKGGSYQGVFPAGLLTCLKIATGNFEFGRVHKKDMNVPIKIRISLLDGHRSVEEVEPVLDSVEVERCYIANEVRRIPVKEGNIRGVLYLPEGDGPFPGVIDMFGATGVLYEGRAALNASRGIASLALAYFNYDDIPWQRIHNMNLDYFEEALDFLRSRPEVFSDRLGVVGNCFGGFLAFMMGLHMEPIKATYIINASYNPFFGQLKYGDRVLIKNTFKELVFSMGFDEQGVMVPTEGYNKSLHEPSPELIEEFNALPSDKYFHVSSGEDDCYKFHIAWYNFEKMFKAEKKTNFCHKVYPMAGHLIHPPNTPFSSIVFGKLWGLGDNKGMLLKFGGEPQSTYNMQKAVADEVPEFFKKHLGRG